MMNEMVDRSSDAFLLRKTHQDLPVILEIENLCEPFVRRVLQRLFCRLHIFVEVLYKFSRGLRLKMLPGREIEFARSDRMFYPLRHLGDQQFKVPHRIDFS
jgi:hypothetical protein